MAGQPITRAKKEIAAKRRAEREANGGKRITRNPTPASKRDKKKEAAANAEAEGTFVEFGGHTDAAWQLFVKEYLECGRQDMACKKSGIPRETVYKRKRQDVEFAAVMEEARSICMESLEDAAIRRARDGVLEPNYNNRTGERMGWTRKYSDGLLQFMLMHGKPEKYRPAQKQEIDQTVGFKGGKTPTLNVTLAGSSGGMLTPNNTNIGKKSVYKKDSKK